jgi:diaminohydroxyphosphoribosylaminopyrimidine deaminase / 5-amino-6-(5-phosphoribosylamino)uracil reductase
LTDQSISRRARGAPEERGPIDTSVVTEQDRRHMRRAIELARRGIGSVSPNPPVGAVIVGEGGVLGEGWHGRLGGPHAEAAALADARDRGAEVRGATMYVTLEPCAHHGRQPPCAEAIVAAGLGRVVIGCDDPTEKASGRGPGTLRDEGIAVEFAEGAEAAEARLLIQPFRKHARTGHPLVTLKSATTLDGHTATRTGESKWISGDASRELVHRWRSASDAVGVGIGTALADDPTLTARGVGATRQPARVVFDSGARLPLSSRLVRTATEAPVLVLAGDAAPAERVDALTNAGAEVIACPGETAERLGFALGELGRRGITSLLLEGGPTLAGAFVAAGEVDRLEIFCAPLLLGGGDGRGLLAGAGPEHLGAASRALSLHAESSGEDVLLSAKMREW